MKICFVDTYYPDALRAMPIGNGSYQEELDKVLAWQFGTADFYSREFRKIGWDAIDIIANHEALQRRWPQSQKLPLKAIALAQIEAFKPDVVFIQDLSFFSMANLMDLQKHYRLAAQCSCALPDNLQIIARIFRPVFTSFNHYISKFDNAVYMPLAFHESVLTPSVERDIDVSFVGGLGRQWRYGEQVLETIAREVPTARFYGYGYDKLPSSSPLKQKYCGHAWGRDMYSIYQRSKIVVNRHAEFAQNHANNMRIYEAAGCGAILVTEHKDNIWDLFEPGDVVTYNNAAEAVREIKAAIRLWDNGLGERGQRTVLARHTYAHRIPKIAEFLTK